ncbi:hypothetical protein TanjilG_10101 [Lupinus angustifolius]|uniref:RING-type E3 ubiquitin transferase n=2 Tax=Lupinus angustifolius TaxID=3871 RepID=A0A1J7H2M9_LUPAN|nr:hypothetical protein TanjilG_10101 [Lupinus angustifolius]
MAIPLSAILLMGFFTIYTRYCAHSPSYNFDNFANGRRFRGTTRGLDPSVIETFPFLEYSVVKIHKIGKCDLECAVCLDEFEDTETLRLIPKCDHVFHPQCIDEWFESHTTCPVCRANLAPQPAELVHVNPILITHPECIEPQNNVVLTMSEQQERERSEQTNVILINQTLNRIRTRRSRSNRKSRFPRSYSTGHSMVQPRENTERFTLRLPFDVREKIMQNPKLNRARSMVTLRRDKSDPFVFTMTPPFLVRESSFKALRVTNNAVAPQQLPQPTTVDSACLPV